MSIHKPVLLKEVSKILNPSPGKILIDATFGGGGHSFNLANSGATIISMDKDPVAVREGERLLSQACLVLHNPEDNGEPKSFSLPSGGKITLFHESFSNLDKIARSQNPDGKVDGVLFDLGLSSDQLKGERGFSFQLNSSLDMRFDPSRQGVTAADLIKVLSEKQLYEIFNEFSQEKYARPIARAIVRARLTKPIQTTAQLVEIITQTVPYRKQDIHPATRVFQALRIAVNTEFDELETGLNAAWSVLKPNGVIATISFHSGEDRIVKNFGKSRIAKLSDIIIPSSEEISTNPRARSAKLRVITKV